MQPRASRILIINCKGACGKTTIVTNLAVAYATDGHVVALMDQDSQASATDWMDHRSVHLSPIHLVPAHQRGSLYETRAYQQRIPDGTDRVIIDAASTSSEHRIDDLLRLADIIIVPIVPSSIDIRAGSKFIADLLTHKAYRNNPLPVAVVANRIKWNTAAHDRLMDFLRCLDVPTAAKFRDIAQYTECAEDGTGICDFAHLKAAAGEAKEWRALVSWIERQTAPAGNLRRANPIRARVRHKVDTATQAVD